MKEKKSKPLSVQQIKISIDRLTRFKSTEEKYLRVFKDIILSNLVCPKFKKTDLDKMDYREIRDWAEFVFNNSFDTVNKDLTLNYRLMDYEKSVFKFDKNVEHLLKNKLNYNSALKVIGDDLPKNLLWLKDLQLDENSADNRRKKGYGFPIESVVLVEGITEEILLPLFAKLNGFDFDKMGVKIVSAGGKNQVVKLFYKFSEILKLPMFVLLDNDAKENQEAIKPKLRKYDKIHLVKCGEFEDLLPLGLIEKTLNLHFKNFSSVSISELNKNAPMVSILEEIFKEKGLHEFKKAEFANLVAQNLSKNDVSQEISDIITELKATTCFS